MEKPRWQRVVIAVALATSGVIVGANMSTTNVAHGEVTGTPERPAFQSGGQQSVPILREIASTLQQMDARLARLETAAQKIQMNATRSAAAEETTDAN
jgi:hypothetical protein